MEPVDQAVPRLKKTHDVAPAFKRGQTGLSGENAIDTNVNDALDKCNKEWVLFEWFHAVYGMSAQFNEGLVRTSLTSCRAR
jgi:hypothetical protein